MPVPLKKYTVGLSHPHRPPLKRPHLVVQKNNLYLVRIVPPHLTPFGTLISIFRPKVQKSDGDGKRTEQIIGAVVTRYAEKERTNAATRRDGKGTTPPTRSISL